MPTLCVSAARSEPLISGLQVIHGGGERCCGIEPAVGSFAAAPFGVVESSSHLMRRTLRPGTFPPVPCHSTMRVFGPVLLSDAGDREAELCSIAARNTSVKPRASPAKESRKPPS